MTLKNKSRIAIAMVASCVSLVAAVSDDVQYPENYRNWVHVKSGQGSAGLHHIYANELAMTGYQTGTFPDGSVLVFDLLEVVKADGNTTEGSRSEVDVMAKDGRRFMTSGGWGFERFLQDSKTERTMNAAMQAQCLACHEKRKEHDFVFSEFRR